MNDNIFIQAIDSNYNNKDSFNIEDSADFKKILDNFDLNDFYNDNSTVDCELKRFSSTVEKKSNSRKISDTFAVNWSENLNILKKKAVHSLPFYTVQIKSNKANIDIIPHMSLDS
jgi:hypothetical protein